MNMKEKIIKKLSQNNHTNIISHTKSTQISIKKDKEAVCLESKGDDGNRKEIFLCCGLGGPPAVTRGGSCMKML